MSDNAKDNNCDDTKPSCDTTNAGPETSKDTPPPQVNLLEVPINTEHDALNVIRRLNMFLDVKKVNHISQNCPKMLKYGFDTLKSIKFGFALNII